MDSIELHDMIESYIIEAEKTLNQDAERGYLSSGLWGELGELFNLYKKHAYHNKPAPDEEFISEIGDCFWYVSMLLGRYDIEWRRSAYRLATRVPAMSTSLRTAMGDLLDTVQNGIEPRNTELEFLAYVLANLVDLAELFPGGTRGVLDTNIDKLRRRYPTGFVAYADRSDLQPDSSSSGDLDVCCSSSTGCVGTTKRK